MLTVGQPIRKIETTVTVSSSTALRDASDVVRRVVSMATDD